MRNVNAEIGYILNNIRWDKYDPKTINYESKIHSYKRV